LEDPLDALNVVRLPSDLDLLLERVAGRFEA
jgi:hypothetical protein